MGDFVTTVLSLPTVIFTVPLGLSLFYWLFVVIGAIDIDALDGLDGGVDGALDGVDGALDGAADGAFDGAFDGLDALDGAEGALDALDGVDGALDGQSFGLDALDGVLDGLDALDAVEPSLEGDVDAPSSSGSPSLVALLLSSLKLTTVPMTVSLSFITLFAWLTSFLMTVHVAPLLQVPDLLAGGAIAAAAFVTGTLGASVAVRPLGGLFHTERGRGNRSFIGSIVTITTGTVDEGFGQAEVTERGHNLIVQVRDRGEQELRKGDRALLVRWSASSDAFIVEKVDLAAADGDVQQARHEAIERIRARVEARKAQLAHRAKTPNN